jgi:predicted exporter
MLSICRTLFFIVIIFSTIFVGNHYDNINISTDLKDLSPTLSKQLSTQKAIDALSKYIESRFILIITGENRKNLEQAGKKLVSELASIDNISTNEASSDSFLEELKTYRFQLLSPEQRKELQNKDNKILIETAQRNLFRIDSTLQILPVTEDPLGTFDHYINYLTDRNLSSNTIHSLTESGKTVHFKTISIGITDGSMEIDRQHILMKKINKLEKELSNKFSIQILRSGVFFFAADAAEKSETDIKLISTISTIGIITLLLFVFRSLNILLLPAASILIGIVFAVGINHYLYGSIHILTIVFGASLIGIIIDYSLHYFYHQKFDPNSTQGRKYTNKLFRAMLLSLITSLVGYSALSFSSLDALKKVALFSCCGIFSAWLSVITIGSLSRMNKVTTNDSIFSLLLSFINSFLKPIGNKLSFPIWGAVVLLGSASLYLFGLPANDNPRLFFNPTEKLLRQEKQANKYSNNFEPGRYIVISSNSSEAIYQRYDALLSAIKPNFAAKENDTFFSAMQLLPSPTQQQQDYQLQSKIYAKNGIAENLFLNIGLPPEQAIMLNKIYLANNNKTLKPTILFNEKSSLPPVWLQNGEQYIGFVLIKKGVDVELLEKAITNSKNQLQGVTFINTLALAESALKEQRLSASILLLLAYLFIAFIMLAYYRSAKALWVLLVPITATLGTLVIFNLLNINITLFNVMGLFLVLGLGMDYVIFIKEMDEHNFHPPPHSQLPSQSLPPARSQSVTQNAILLSTLTTLLSFGLLSLSSIPVAQAFGTTLLIGNTLNFLGSLLYAQLNQKTSANKERALTL